MAATAVKRCRTCIVIYWVAAPCTGRRAEWPGRSATHVRATPTSRPRRAASSDAGVFARPARGRDIGVRLPVGPGGAGAIHRGHLSADAHVVAAGLRARGGGCLAGERDLEWLAFRRILFITSGLGHGR